MDATSVSHLTITITNPLFTHSTSILLPETICRLLPVVSCKTRSLHLKNSSIRAYTTFSRKSVLGRAYVDGEFTRSTTSDDKSMNREKLTALFKRIQTEISQGESRTGNYVESSQSSNDDDSSVEISVLEFLKQSNRDTKDDISKLKLSEDTISRRNTRKPPSTTNFTRPPSNFVKRSPIPSPLPLRINETEVSNREESSSAADKEFLKIDKMKLSELKGLAKERGLKGYSKLKKSELVQLLKIQVK